MARLTGFDFALARYEGLSSDPLDEAEMLISDVQNLVSNGALNNGQGNSLLVKIQAAIRQIDKGNNLAAINELAAFINQLEAFIAAGQLTQAEGQPLIDAANDLINQLNNSLSKQGITENGQTTVPMEFTLEQNYPNPFNPSTTIHYAVQWDGIVEIKIYNLLGKLVRTLVNEHKRAGEYSIVWDGKEDFGRLVASGNYYYQFKAAEFQSTKKMLFLK